MRCQHHQFLLLVALVGLEVLARHLTTLHSFERILNLCADVRRLLCIHSGIQILNCAGRYAAFNAWGKAHHCNFFHIQMIIILLFAIPSEGASRLVSHCKVTNKNMI